MFLIEFCIDLQLEFENVDMKKLTEVEELEVTSGSRKPKEKDSDASSNMVMVLRKIANHPLLVRLVLVLVFRVKIKRQTTNTHIYCLYAL